MFTNLKSVWISLVLFLSFSGVAFPALANIAGENPISNYCGGILEEAGAPISPSSWQKPSFGALKSNLQAEMQKKGVAKAQEEKINERLDALYFIDYKDHAEELFQGVLSGKSLTAMNYPSNYEVSNWKQSNIVFKNFEEAQGLIENHKGPLDENFLKRLHTTLMQKGVEGLSSSALGVYRDKSVVGNPSHWITADQVAAINENPYLWFEQTQTQEGLFLGRVRYPDPIGIKAETLERIKTSAPDVYAEVVKLKESIKNLPPEKLAIPRELTRKLVNALIEERLRWLVLQRNQMGDPHSPELFREYVALGASIQRDLISIHPFENGNGRTMREFLYAYLRQQDIPPPRIVMPDDDVETTLAAWTAEIENGISSTQKLYVDFAQRMKLGLSLEKSPFLILPTIPASHLVALKTEIKTPPPPRATSVDPSQFLAYVKTRLSMDPSLVAKFKGYPNAILEELKDGYIKNVESFTLDYNHPKDGLREIGLRFADPDYLKGLGNQAARNTEAWKYKMEQWYRPELVWRGLSYRDREVTEDELVGMFKDFNGQLLSMHSTKASSQNLLNSIRTDYERYNRDLVTGDIYNMAKDHHQTGPLYADSYGFSTSKNSVVGKAFAMGAMVIAPYGKQMEFQHLLKSRVNIGMRRANSYVDLGRLHQFNKDFAYIYGRQQEVMGIGAADPDSVSVIHLYDALGQVTMTYARNPEIPSQIWVINGDYDPSAENAEPPTPEQLLKTVDLFPAAVTPVAAPVRVAAAAPGRAVAPAPGPAPQAVVAPQAAVDPAVIPAPVVIAEGVPQVERDAIIQPQVAVPVVPPQAPAEAMVSPSLGNRIKGWFARFR